MYARVCRKLSYRWLGVIRHRCRETNLGPLQQLYKLNHWAISGVPQAIEFWVWDVFIFIFCTRAVCLCVPVYRESTIRTRGQIRAWDPPWTGVRQWARGAGNQIQVLLTALIQHSSPGQQLVLESSSPDFKIFTEHLRNKRISVHHSWHCL